MADIKREDFNALGAAERIVYVRAVRPEELPDAVERAEVYGIHDIAGNRIGVAPDRELAFLAARQHELNPVSVH